MIFVHLLIGIILGQLFGNTTFFIAGSIFPDIDHIYIIIKNKLWTKKKIIESIKFEKKFGIKYKTPLIHSILGLIVFSSVLYLITPKAMYFAIGYLLHLLLDWPDIDEKQFLYPLKTRSKGFLPIWSKTEQILTIILAIIIIYLALA